MADGTTFPTALVIGDERRGASDGEPILETKYIAADW